MIIGIDARPLSFQRTGIGNYLHNTILNLAEMDEENEYYLFSNVDFNHEVLIKRNWKKIISNDRIGALWLGVKLPILLKRYSIDVFWGTQHMVPLYKLRNTKYVVTMHDFALFHFPYVATTYLNIVNRIFIPRSLKLSSKVISVSESTKLDALKLFKVDKNKIEVIGEGVGEGFRPLDREYSKKVVKEKLEIDYPFLLYVGTIEPRKNLNNLIKAFSIFSKEKKDYKLVITGKKGWKFESIFELIDELNLKDKIVFTGYVDEEDLICMYNACDIFIFPSLYEGFGLPVLEAMQCGINVITSNVSSLPEVMPDAEALVEPNDYNALAKKISNFIENKSLFNVRNIELSKRYSWLKTAEHTLKILKSTYSNEH